MKARKILSLVLCVLCMMYSFNPVAGFAEEADHTSIANGVVEAAEFIDLTAPYTGTLEAFDLRVGDTVSANELLMKMMVTSVYAPIDGKVNYIFGKPGDDASALSSRYGGVIGIEPDHFLQLNCTTTNAYTKSANRTIHLGEKVYLRHPSGSSLMGEGVVISVPSKTDYVVEVTTNKTLTIDERGVRVYRDKDFAKTSYIGTGDVTRSADEMVAAEGRIYRLLTQQDKVVNSGALLMELMGADAAPDASPLIRAPKNAVVGAISVESGANVWKGQHLLRLYLTDKMEVKAEVDEVDLNNVKVGDTVPVKLDTDQAEVFQGTVTRISSVGVKQANAAFFDVYISIPAEFAKIGVSASVYIPRS